METLSLEDIHGMTPEKLRTYPGLENLADGQAEKIILSLYQLLTVFFEYQSVENLHCIENQSVVYLDEQKQAA